MRSQACHPARFAIWAEDIQPRPRAARRGRKAKTSGGRPPLHPFCVRAGDLADVLAAAGAGVEGAGTVALLARLPAVGGLPLPSTELQESGATSVDGAALSTWTIDAVVFEGTVAASALTSVAEDAASTGVVLGDDLRFWVVATRFTLELLYRQRFFPVLLPEGDTYVARWQPVLEAELASDRTGSTVEPDLSRFSKLATSMPPACRALAWDSATVEPGPLELLKDYLECVSDSVARSANPFPAPPMKRRPTAGEAWLRALQGDQTLGLGSREASILCQHHREWSEPARLSADAANAFRVCFRLDPPAPEAGATGAGNAGQGARNWTIEYLLQATDDPSLLVTAEDVWRQRGATAKFLNRRFENPQERFLSGLGQASRLFPPIEQSLRTARPETCPLTLAEAHDFVREKAVLLQSSGFGVLVPGLETRLGVRVRFRGRAGAGAAGLGMLGWQSVVGYDWQIALGEDSLSREEFEQLARLKEPLVQVRGRWVELKPEEIQQALAFFEKQAGGEMSLQEALRLSLAPDDEHGLPIVEVAAEGWVDDLLNELRETVPHAPVVEPDGFSGRLRPYQKLGVSWLASLRLHGLGACLADDMGLGKTVQLIATLLHQPRSSSGDEPSPALLICPTSVVGNWRRELSRFAPGLRVLVHHGAGRNKEEFAREALGHDVVISTYALLHRDEEHLAAVKWGDVILDEAQNVKNAATKASQAARRLSAQWRAALTGTPVENRLSDLWSVFEFLNPGYLGSGPDFKRRFAEPIERARDSVATEKLKMLVSPFILGRVKSDRSVIEDLPEKNEMKVFCNLTREQGTLYEAVVQESMRAVEEAEGVQRRGMVLATLTKLKQVCNHPALFLHDGSRLGGRSGKLARLEEMLEETLAVGDRTLIFTQYAEMGRLLREHLEAAFRQEVLFLHGGTPAAQRDKMVARFQSEGRGPQLFILSIKAGGTGLNLTRASHVFHFDRWWNPAVENQATDRAFRIGQTRNVQVHKFVCAGTFEEVVDQLIERKVELAEKIVGTSEAWITEMSSQELRDLFALRGDAVEEV